MTNGRKLGERRRWAWGLILIGLGVVFMLVEFGGLGDRPWRTIWGWWPAILVVMGLVHIVAPERPKQIASGVSEVLLGLWFFACIFHWYDLRFSTAWPILLVIYGGEMILAAALEPRSGRKKGDEHHA